MRRASRTVGRRHTGVTVLLTAAVAVSVSAVSIAAQPAAATGGYSTEVMADTPVGWWRLGDAPGTREPADSSAAGRSLKDTSADSGFDFGQPGAILGDSDTAGTLDLGHQGARLGADQGTPSFWSDAASSELWVKPTSSTSTGRLMALTTTCGGGAPMELDVDNGHVTASAATRDNATTTGETTQTVTAPAPWTAGEWHHVVSTAGDGQLKLYLDGARVASVVTNKQELKNCGSQLNLYYGGVPGVYDELAYYTTALSYQRVRDHFAASGRTPPPIGNSELRGQNKAYRHNSPGQGCAGDPCDTQFGNQHLDYDLLSVPGRGPGLDFSLAYNSQGARNDGPFGHGWSSAYDMSFVSEPNGTKTIVQENGSTVTFESDGTGGWVAPPRFSAELVDNNDGTFTFTRKHFEIFTFDDSSGTLLSLADGNGNTTTLGYALGQLSYAEDPAGRRLTFHWTGNHVDTVTDSRASGDGGPRSVGLAIDGSGDLTDITDVFGHVRSFTYYPGTHWVATRRDPRFHLGTVSQVTTDTYDSDGRIKTQTDELGHTTSFDYDTPVPDATSITEPDGDVRVDWYEGGLRTRVTYAYGTSDQSDVYYNYNQDTRAAMKMTDGDGKVWIYGYDTVGNLTSTTDPISRSTGATYNILDEPLTITDIGGVTTKYEYDTNGNLLKTTQALGTADQAETTYTYDSAHPGDIKTVTDPRTNVWSFGYDPSTGYLTSRTAPGTGELPTTYEYDSVGRLTGSVSPQGNTIPGVSDEAYRTHFDLSFTSTTETETTTDPLDHTTAKTYDQNGNLRSVQDADGGITVYDYFDDDQLKLATTASNGDKPSTTSYTYYPDGTQNTRQTTDAGTYTYTYDHLNRLQTETPPKHVGTDPASVTTYAYDKRSLLTSIQQPGGDCGAVSPSGCIKYNYDDAGQLNDDPAHSIKAVDYSDPATPDIATVDYDADGRRSAVTESTETSSPSVTNATWTWDNLGRLKSQTNENGDATGYLWDPAGNLTNIAYPGGNCDSQLGAVTKCVTRHFDAAGRLDWISDWLSNTTDFHYDADSNLDTTTFPSATTNVDTFTFDHADRLAAISWKQGTTALGSETYTRTNEGLLDTVTRTGSAGTTGSDFDYDRADRLTTDNSPTVAYGYDGASNLTKLPDGRLQVFDPAQQLCWSSPAALSGSCTTPPTDATIYSYDNRGNRISKSPAVGAKSTFGYDQANRLTTATVPTTVGGDGQFTPLPPARVLDTRSASRTGTCDTGGCVTLSPSTTKRFKVNGLGGVPATGVRAVTIDLIAIATTSGNVKVNKSTSSQAAQATVFYQSSSNASTTAVASVDSSGYISLYAGDAIDVVVDVNGWFAAPDASQSGSLYYPTAAARLADTRSGSATGTCNGVTCSKPTGAATIKVATAQHAGLPAGASAVVLSVVALNSTAAGSLKVNPTSSNPAGAVVNFGAGQSLSGFAVASIASDGTITIKVSGSVDFFIDIAGYEQPSDGATGNIFVPVPASRAVDTRSSSTTGACTPSPCARLASGGSLTAQIAGVAGVPVRGVTAVAVSVSAYNPSADGTLKINKSTGGLPAELDLAFTSGQSTDDGAIVSLNSTGKIVISSSGAAVDAIVDITGYYTAATETWHYTYDSDGLRTGKTSSAGDNIAFDWSQAGSLPLLLAQHNGANTTFLIYGPDDRPLEQINPDGSVNWLHVDQLGSVRMSTNATGSSLSTARWSPYGTPESVTGSQPLLGFAGEYTDSETGYLYMRNRYYDPGTAQWTTRDPQIGATLEAFSYVGDDPLNNIDPNGTNWLTDKASGAVRTVTHGAKSAWDHTGGKVVSTVADTCVAINNPNCESYGKKHPALVSGLVVLADASAVVACTAATFGTCAAAIVLATQGAALRDVSRATSRNGRLHAALNDELIGAFSLLVGYPATYGLQGSAAWLFGLKTGAGAGAGDFGILFHDLFGSDDCDGDSK